MNNLELFISDITSLGNSTSLLITLYAENNALSVSPLLWKDPPQEVMGMWKGDNPDKKLVAAWASEATGYTLVAPNMVKWKLHGMSDADCPPGAICRDGQCTSKIINMKNTQHRMNTIKEMRDAIDRIWLERNSTILTLDEHRIKDITIEKTVCYIVFKDNTARKYKTSLGEKAADMFKGTDEDKALLVEMLNADLGLNINVESEVSWRNRKVQIHTGQAGYEMFKNLITKEWEK